MRRACKVCGGAKTRACAAFCFRSAARNGKQAARRGCLPGVDAVARARPSSIAARGPVLTLSRRTPRGDRCTRPVRRGPGRRARAPPQDGSQGAPRAATARPGLWWNTRCVQHAAAAAGVSRRAAGRAAWRRAFAFVPSHVVSRRAIACTGTGDKYHVGSQAEVAPPHGAETVTCL